MRDMLSPTGANRRSSWREDLSVAKHAARLGRSQSEGCIISSGSRTGRRSESNAKAVRRATSAGKLSVGLDRSGAEAVLTSKEEIRFQAECRRASQKAREIQVVEQGGRGPSHLASRAKAKEDLASLQVELSEFRSEIREAVNSREAPPNYSGGKVHAGKDLYQQVSSLVEELEAARSHALTSGGRPPRAIEAAASALEPLLRLRDATGSFSCDLTLMPWLPQLLAVFRNVLHTAVDGPGAPPRIPSVAELGLETRPACEFVHSNADSGIGGLPSNLAAAVADVAGDSSGSADSTGLTWAAALVEIEALREHSRQQDAQLQKYKQQQDKLQQELKDLRQERRQLLQEVSRAGSHVEAFEDELAEASAEEPSSLGEPLHNPADAERRRLEHRLAGLERQNCAWQTEKRSVEERVLELVGLVTAAVEAPKQRTRERGRRRRSAA